MIFQSDLTTRSLVLPRDIDLRKLPQLFRADMEFARAQGSEDLNYLLDHFKLSGHYKYVSMDCRTHMLMKGMYPCIPGWHCDDFYRTEDLQGQPDLENVGGVAPQVHHMLILGDNSKTEFLAKNIDLPGTRDVQEQFGIEKPVYYQYDRMLDELKPKTLFVNPGTIYTFGPTAFHRGQASTHNGWRFFLRVTESNHYEPKNELRYQTQVYTDGRVSW
jgi:hypothetical protein